MKRLALAGRSLLGAALFFLTIAGCGGSSPDADETNDNDGSHDPLESDSGDGTGSDEDTEKGECPWTCLTTKGCDTQGGTVMLGFTCPYPTQICCRPEGDTTTGATDSYTGTTDSQTGGTASDTDTAKPPCSYTCRTAANCSTLGGTVHAEMSCAQAGRVCCQDGDTDTGVSCEAMGVSVSGALQTSVSNVTFNSGSIAMGHKIDIDEYEDGCISSLNVELFNSAGGSSGCYLSFNTDAQFLWDGWWMWEGGLAVSDLTFNADSYCAGFPDEDEGYYYQSYGDLHVSEVVLDTLEVPQYMANTACVVTTATIRLEGTLGDGYGGLLTVEPTEIVLTGGFLSYGSTGNSCPCEPTCTSGSSCDDYDGCAYYRTCGDCDHLEGGDTDTGSDTSGDWCAGYTGSNTCCYENDPCGYSNDNICDCGGYCYWDSYDCY